MKLGDDVIRDVYRPVSERRRRRYRLNIGRFLVFLFLVAAAVYIVCLFKEAVALALWIMAIAP